MVNIYNNKYAQARAHDYSQNNRFNKQKSRLVFLNRKMIFMGYSWNPEQDIDFYQQGIVNGFRQLGYEVHVLTVNKICPIGRMDGISSSYSAKKLSKLISSINPNLILSMNHGGLFSEILSNFKGPIIDLIVDELSHLFMPSEIFKTNNFPNNLFVVTTNSDSFKYFKKNCNPKYKDNIILSSCVSDFQKDLNIKAVHNISFVGSYLNIAPAQYVFWQASVSDDNTALAHINLLLSELERDYHSDFPTLLKKYNLIQFFEDLNIKPDEAKHYLANYISSKARLDTVKILSPLGLTLYGNDIWLNSLSENPKILEQFKFGSSLSSRKDLCNVYNSSKISIHISQAQVPGTLSYRIFDIMKSNSLLMLPYSEKSDALIFFNEGCPVPMYRDLDHLYELCDYYLKNEEERLELVEKCNNLVATGFSFQDRAKQMLNMAKQPFENEYSGELPKEIKILTNNFKKLF